MPKVTSSLKTKIQLRSVSGGGGGGGAPGVHPPSKLLANATN